MYQIAARDKADDLSGLRTRTYLPTYIPSERHGKFSRRHLPSYIHTLCIDTLGVGLEFYAPGWSVSL